MPQIGIADKNTQDNINTKVGTNADVSGTATVFARLRQIYEYSVNSIYSYLTTNMSNARMAKIDNLDNTISSRQASWGATTTHSARIDTNISTRAAQTSVDTINTNVNTVNTKIGTSTDTGISTLFGLVKSSGNIIVKPSNNVKQVLVGGTALSTGSHTSGRSLLLGSIIPNYNGIIRIKGSVRKSAGSGHCGLDIYAIENPMDYNRSMTSNQYFNSSDKITVFSDPIGTIIHSSNIIGSNGARLVYSTQNTISTGWQTHSFDMAVRSGEGFFIVLYSSGSSSGCDYHAVTSEAVNCTISYDVI